MVPISTEKLATIARIASLAWWIYVVVILCLFFGGLLLNYIVKKINETRLENRYNSLRNKTSTNQSTQVQRQIEIEKRSTMLSGNVSENINKGISLVFNKEENLLEDKRRRDDLLKYGGKTDCVITVDSSENIAKESTSAQSKDEYMNKSVFLGTIYKELYEKRVIIEKSKSLSNADRDSILNEIVDKMMWKVNESKSTPSIKKSIEIQNEKDLKDWALDLVRKNDEAPAPASTSGCYK